MRLVLLFVLIFISIESFAAESSTRTRPSARDRGSLFCIGPRDALYGAVYLHGTDRPYGKREELANLIELEHLAERMKLRIALPRAAKACGTMDCWGVRMTDGDYFELGRQIRAAIDKCGLPRANVGAIGFSSGAYKIVEAFKRGLFDSRSFPVSWGIAVGAGKNWSDKQKHGRATVSGRLTLMQGLRDPHKFDPSRKLYRSMLKLTDSVRLVEFYGGHELPGFELEREISRLTSF